MTRRRWILAVAALVVATPLVAVGYVLAVGLTVDASGWRQAIVARASASLGRTVMIDGPLEVTLGRTVRLRLGGLRIANPPGFEGADFATLGEASAEIDLVAALRGRLVVRALEASDARVRLQRAADERANWAFPAREAGGAPADREAGRFAIDVETLTLRRADVEYVHAATSRRHALALDELRATGGWRGPLAVTAQGRAARSLPYAITVAGGPVRALVEGTGAWPCTVDVALAGARLHVTGDVTPSDGTLRLMFGAGTDDLEALEQLFGARLPEFGVAALSGRVVAQPGRVELSGLRGVLGESEVSGQLTFTVAGEGTRATGDLALANLDLRPFLRDSARDTREPLTYEDLANSTVALRGLLPFAAAVNLRIDQVSGAGVAVRDARLQLTADERGLRMPLEANVADVPITGLAEVDTSGPTPLATVELGARGTRLGEVALALAGLEGVDGALRQVALRVAGRGETLGAAVRDLEARLEAVGARLSYGSLPGGRPVEVSLAALVVEAPRGQRIRGSARGTLLGKAASISFRGPDLQRLMSNGPFPAELNIAARGAKARIEGRAPGPASSRFVPLAFSLEAERSGELAAWLGVAPESALPVSVRGEARFPASGWEVRDLRVRVGRSDVAGDVRRGVSGTRPVTVANLASTAIDWPELATLRAREAGARGRDRASLLEVPILPRDLDLADADIDLRIGRVALRPAEAQDVRFTAHVREGRLPPSPFAAKVAGVPFAGTLALDLRSELPEAAVALQASDVDVGRLLRALQLAEDIDAQVAALEMTLNGRGARLGEFLENAVLRARLSRGEIALRGPASRVAARMRLDEGLVRTAPGQAVEARLVGELDGTPVEAGVTTARLSEILRGATRVPLRAEALAAGAKLRLEGEVDLPLGRGGHLTMEASGERLDSLSGLAGAALPPWGPWALGGPIAMTETGYSMSALALRIGESQLTGSGTLDVAGARPRLELRVQAPRLRLDDFPRERPEAPGDRVAAPGEGSTVAALRGYASATATRTERLLGAQFLRRVDAYVDVHVEEIVAGRDKLGEGALRLRLADGRLQVGPAVLHLQGGTATLAAEYDALQGGVSVALGAHSEAFDYGVLARREWPDSDTEGRFSLDLTLKGEAPSLDAILASANGRVDFVAWPRDLGARRVDFWVVNLVRSVLPMVTRGEPSVVNCIVGRFDLVDGKLRDDVFIIDTTRARIFGTGGIDFATEAIDFRFTPRAKGLGFGTIEPPIRFTGTLSNFGMDFTRSDLLATVRRFFTSLVVVPLQTLFRGPLPADGRDVCGGLPDGGVQARP